MKNRTMVGILFAMLFSMSNAHAHAQHHYHKVRDKAAMVVFLKKFEANANMIDDRTALVQKLFSEDDNSDEWKIKAAAAMLDLRFACLEGKKIHGPECAIDIESEYHKGMDDIIYALTLFPHAYDHQNMKELKDCMDHIDLAKYHVTTSGNDFKYLIL